MKKIIVLLIMNILMISMVGCGQKGKENDNSSVSTEDKQIIETETQQNTENVITVDTEEVSADTQVEQSIEDIQRKYLEVLRNETSFIDTNNNSTPSYINNIFYGNEVVCTPEKFALVDYDNDGSPEVCILVDLGFDKEFVVLHYFDGNVYGYSFGYRSMQEVGNNGYYIGSSGAAYTSILSLNFNKNEIVENTVAYSDLDSENNPIYFSGDGNQIDEADWSLLLNSVEDDSVEWHSFEDDAWEAYFLN